MWIRSVRTGTKGLQVGGVGAVWGTPSFPPPRPPRRWDSRAGRPARPQEGPVPTHSSLHRVLNAPHSWGLQLPSGFGEQALLKPGHQMALISTPQGKTATEEINNLVPSRGMCFCEAFSTASCPPFPRLCNVSLLNLFFSRLFLPDLKKHKLLQVETIPCPITG